MLKAPEAHKIVPTTTVISDKLRTGQVTVGTKPTYIAQREARNSLQIRNIGDVSMYVGPLNVTTISGFLVRPLESLSLDRTFGEVYAIVANGSTIVCWLEE